MRHTVITNGQRVACCPRGGVKPSSRTGGCAGQHRRNTATLSGGGYGAAFWLTVGRIINDAGRSTGSIRVKRSRFPTTKFYVPYE
jgi:hypothetical protein